MMTWSEYCVFCLIFVVCVLAVAKINYDNGKIAQCKELNMFPSVEKGCISCEDSGRNIINGKCKKNEERNYLQEYVDNELGGK